VLEDVDLLLKGVTVSLNFYLKVKTLIYFKIKIMGGFQASISSISYVTLSHVLIALQFTPDESYPFLDPTTVGVL